MKPPLGRMLHVECIDERGTLLLVEAVGRCPQTIIRYSRCDRTHALFAAAAGNASSASGQV